MQIFLFLHAHISFPFCITLGASIVELPGKKRIGAKRKRVDRGDPSDIDGYLGPWAGYVDEQKVAKPSEVCLCLCV